MLLYVPLRPFFATLCPSKPLYTPLQHFTPHCVLCAPLRPYFAPLCPSMPLLGFTLPLSDTLGPPRLYFTPLRPFKALLCPSLILKSTLSLSTLLYAPTCSLYSTTAPLKPLLAHLWPLYYVHHVPPRPTIAHHCPLRPPWPAMVHHIPPRPTTVQYSPPELSTAL